MNPGKESEEAKKDYEEALEHYEKDRARWMEENPEDDDDVFNYYPFDPPQPPVLFDQPRPIEPTYFTTDLDSPITHWEIKLKWSEYRHNVWAPPRVTSQALESKSMLYGQTPAREWHFFRPTGVPSILCYRRGSTFGTGRFFEYIGRFQFSGCRGKVDAIRGSGHLDPDSLGNPENTENAFMDYVSTDAVTSLTLIVNQKPYSLPVLKKSPSPYRLLTLPDHGQITGLGKFFHPFFYTDLIRTYFVMPTIDLDANQAIFSIRLKFSIFFHPHVCALIAALNRHGISGLLQLSNQERMNDYFPGVIFKGQYNPNTEVVHSDSPIEDVDFNGQGAYSLYNWELFFHAPLLIADRLSKNQRFEDAQKWFHYIFDPTDNHTDEPSPARYWKVLPFYQNKDIVRLDKWLESVSTKEVEAWRDNPFSPHLVARSRLMSYQRTVVMKYIDNLIAWGDQLFSRDTIESINEATQLYIMAYNILGARPQEIPQRGKVKEQTYDKLKEKLDSFSNAPVVVENELPFSSNDQELISKQLLGRHFKQGFPQIRLDGISSQKNNKAGSLGVTTVTPEVSKARQALGNYENSGANGGLGLATAFYFCIPQNDKLLSYWDTVEDRLFKIRHCMNIEGIVRELPLFEPPIDPALLVRATAMGLDLNSVLNDVNSPLPHYRFSYLLQKAIELCAEVKSLGGALLSAIEKKDAEELSLLRADHQSSVLKAVQEVKRQQVKEAKISRIALQNSRGIIEERCKFYEGNLLSGISPCEIMQLDMLEQGNIKHADSMESEKSAAQSSQIPNATIGTSGVSPVLTATFGGVNVVAQYSADAKVSAIEASDYNYQAARSAIEGSYKRRADEWNHQLRLARKDLLQIDKQISAADIRIVISEKGLETHDKEIENAAVVDEYLRTKYTNKDLYVWMLSQISAVFFQSYKLAYDLAKRAEKAYRFERGLNSSNFIQFGYWDSLRKGLLSGERLHLDLKRMEMAYMDQNKREYEITKQISLVFYDPMALITLKETGKCEVHLPEALFDMDYPGHYMRRIKSVNLTIPCVVGPYTSVNCTLTLLKNEIRIDGNAQQAYGKNKEDDDPRFITNFGALQSIATSHAQNDAGMFELNFRDERYLPFEGAGVDSTWRIDLPKDCNAFDFSTISDVIIKLNYTAREGGEVLRKKAREAAVLPDQENLLRLFCAKHEFPTEWYRFLHPTDQAATSQSLVFNLAQERFPFQFRGKTIETPQIELFLKFKNERDRASDNEKTYAQEYADGPAPLKVILLSPGASSDIAPLVSVPGFLGIGHLKIDVTETVPVTFTLEIKETDIQQIAPKLRHAGTANGTTHHRLNPDAIEDLFIVCHYRATG